MNSNFYESKFKQIFEYYCNQNNTSDGDRNSRNRTFSFNNLKQFYFVCLNGDQSIISSNIERNIDNFKIEYSDFKITIITDYYYNENLKDVSIENPDFILSVTRDKMLFFCNNQQNEIKSRRERIINKRKNKVFKDYILSCKSNKISTISTFENTINVWIKDLKSNICYITGEYGVGKSIHIDKYVLDNSSLNILKIKVEETYKSFKFYIEDSNRQTIDIRSVTDDIVLLLDGIDEDGVDIVFMLSYLIGIIQQKSKLRIIILCRKANSDYANKGRILYLNRYKLINPHIIEVLKTSVSDIEGELSHNYDKRFEEILSKAIFLDFFAENRHVLKNEEGEMKLVHLIIKNQLQLLDTKLQKTNTHQKQSNLKYDFFCSLAYHLYNNSGIETSVGKKKFLELYMFQTNDEESRKIFNCLASSTIIEVHKTSKEDHDYKISFSHHIYYEFFLALTIARLIVAEIETEFNVFSPTELSLSNIKYKRRIYRDNTMIFLKYLLTVEFKEALTFLHKNIKGTCENFKDLNLNDHFDYLSTMIYFIEDESIKEIFRDDGVQMKNYKDLLNKNLSTIEANKYFMMDNLFRYKVLLFQLICLSDDFDRSINLNKYKDIVLHKETDVDRKREKEHYEASGADCVMRFKQNKNIGGRVIFLIRYYLFSEIDNSINFEETVNQLILQDFERDVINKFIKIRKFKSDN